MNLFKYTDIHTILDTMTQHDPKIHISISIELFTQPKIRKIGLQIESRNWQIEYQVQCTFSSEATKLSHLVQPTEGYYMLGWSSA